MKARLLILALVSTTLVVSLAPPAVALEPIRVAGTARDDFFPAGSEQYVAWQSQRITRRAFSFHIWVQPATGGDPIRINPEGTLAFMGGIEGSLLVYGRQPDDQTRSDIVLVDLDTQTELPLPEGINTRRAEFNPGISGDTLLFMRRERRTLNVILADLTTGEQTVVFSRTNTRRRFFLFVRGQVNGNYATWATQIHGNRGLISGDAWLHDMMAGTTTKVSAGRDVWEYAASISGDGTMFFGRSSFACGEDAQVIRRDFDGTEKVVYTLPVGRDFTSTYAVDLAGGVTDLLADFGECDGDHGDIWRLSDV